VSVIEAIESGLYALFGLLIAPLAAHPDRGLAIVSLLCGVATIFVFQATSNPAAIRRARSHIAAHILEMRIYQNDLVLILHGLAAALASNLQYLRVVAWPVLLIAVMVAIAITQIEPRFAQAPLGTDDAAVVTVICSPGTDVMSVSVHGGLGAVVEPRSVRVPARREVSCRAGVDSDQRVGDQRPRLFVDIGDASYDFPLAASPETITDGTERSRSPLSGLLHPGLPDLPKSFPIERIEIQYPPARHSLFGWPTNWWMVFIAWSLIGALIPKLLLRIEV